MIEKSQQNIQYNGIKFLRQNSTTLKINLLGITMQNSCIISVPILQRDFILRARLIFLELFLSAGERRATWQEKSWDCVLVIVLSLSCCCYTVYLTLISAKEIPLCILVVILLLLYLADIIYC